MRILALFSALYFCALSCHRIAAENDKALRGVAHTPVTFELFFRALSPQGRYMITQTVTNVFAKPGIRDITDLILVPSTGMKVSNGEIICMGGDAECKAHIWMSCAIKEFPTALHFEIIKCFMATSETESDWLKVMTKCTEPGQLEVVKTCVATSGKSLLQENMVKDRKVSPAWTPYVVINGRTVGDLKTAVLAPQILRSICDAVKGKKPAGCNGISAPEISNSTVSVEIHFRAFCPACQWFISDPLWNLYNTAGFSEIMSLQVIPAAGMSSSFSNPDKLECTSGEVECVGHRWFACAISEYPQTKDHLDIIQCLEGEQTLDQEDWDGKLKKCTASSQLEAMRTCYDSKSISLLKAHMKKEEKLDIPWMPYILVNGKVIGDADSPVMFDNLKRAVCNAYNGNPKLYPASCPTRADIDGGRKPPNAVKDEGESYAKKDVKAEPLSPKKIKMSIYWRAFCPACRWSLSDPVPTLLLDPSVRDRIDFEPVPGAGMTISGSSYSCTSGTIECDGHKWFSCAIDTFPKKEVYLPIIKCLEDPTTPGGKSQWDKKIEICTTPSQRPAIKSCFETKADALVLKHAKHAGQESVGWMPYIVVDGKVLGDAKTGVSLSDMKAAVCAAFTKNDPANLPAICQKRQVTEAVKKPKVVRPCPKKGGGAKYDDPPDIGKRNNDRKAAQNIFVANQPEIDRKLNQGFRYPIVYMGVGMIIIFGLYKASGKKTDGKIM